MDEQYRNASNLNARLTLPERLSTSEQPLPGWIFDQFELPPNVRILEIGCGTGVEDRMSELREALEDELASEGRIYITKETGSSWPESNQWRS